MDSRKLISDATIKDVKKKFLGLTVPQLFMLALLIIGVIILLGPLVLLLKTIFVLAVIAIVLCAFVKLTWK